MSSWRKDNPCAALADASYACIEKNDGDKSACDAHFQAYKACVKAEVACTPAATAPQSDSDRNCLRRLSDADANDLLRTPPDSQASCSRPCRHQIIVATVKRNNHTTSIISSMSTHVPVSAK